MNQFPTLPMPQKIDPNANMVLPAMQIPSFRTGLAINRGVENKILFRVWGGLGDQLCAEPTVRYALKHFKECTFTLASECPDLFRHLQFDRVFNLKQEQPIWDNYFVFNTIVPPPALVWEFFSHCITNAVDFSSLCALRQQLPIADKELISIQPAPKMGSPVYEVTNRPEKHVLVHAGRHWPSKTFPKDWWDEVLRIIVDLGRVPVLIGADTDDNRGTVDVETNGCLDLRNKTSVSETIWLAQRSKVLLTNDSAPLHLAVSHDPNDPMTGNAWIGFVATCKHYDYIQHWRRGQWAWRMKNFGKGGMWELTDYCPNKKEEVTVEFLEEKQLRAWLPSPEEFAVWAVEKSKE